MSRDRRRAAWSFGRRGETLAAWWLRCKGYRILAQDFRAKVGEIDLIARRGGTLALVEVKARQSEEAAAEAVRPEQRRRVARAALAFLQRHPALSALRLRFDVIFIVPGRMPRHVPDAWRHEPPGGV
ncbi:MAG: YraN family protein [Kiloniellales bacterium]|nr:YraN family protein [Kiloniellales bacterium]